MTNRDMLTQIFPNNIEDRLCPQALDSNLHCPNMSISCDTCTDRWFQAEYIPPNSAELEEEEEPQFTRVQEERIDEVYNAVLEMCCKLTAGGEKEVEYNMALLGPLRTILRSILHITDTKFIFQRRPQKKTVKQLFTIFMIIDAS